MNLSVWQQLKQARRRANGPRGLVEQLKALAARYRDRHKPHKRWLEHTLVVLTGGLLLSGVPVTSSRQAGEADQQLTWFERDIFEQHRRSSERQTGVPEPLPVVPSAVAPAVFTEALKHGGAELGSLSIGRANRGLLYNGVRLEDGPLWHVMEPKRAFGTEETVRAIEAAISEVNRLYPASPILNVGHLSSKAGGWLRPHRSHQSGRDVDLGFYYTHGADWYKTATDDNFDVKRNWALLSSLLKASPVEYIFLASYLHDRLREEAERIGEDAEFLRQIFDGDKTQKPVLRHARGHQTHFHVRFVSESSLLRTRKVQHSLGRRAYARAALVRILKSRRQKHEAGGTTARKRQASRGRAASRNRRRRK